jgi:hypothetical protein
LLLVARSDGSGVEPRASATAAITDGGAFARKKRERVPADYDGLA